MRSLGRGLWILLLASGMMADGHQVPDTLVIDELENIFEPVVFYHQLHAEMSNMGSGCATCHHYSKDDVYQPCGECHERDEDQASMAMPTLNGAYHRNCLNCHQDWTNEKLCETCHVQKKFRFRVRNSLDKTDILAYKHTEIVVPEHFSFVGPDRQQLPVVFQHKEHVDLYRYKCEHCHTKSNCASCHDHEFPAKDEIISLETHHDPCSSCHSTENETQCAGCHRATPSPGFTHISTGFELKEYHGQVDCASCHPGTSPIEAPDRDCMSCHEPWEAGDIEHSITGLELSEEHQEIDCYECHLDDRYDISPSCQECHDEDIAYPASLPGVRTEKPQK